MSFLFFIMLVGFLASLVGVASNPAPYFAALGLVFGAGIGCGILIWLGNSFLSLVLFLIYLGGMLVVFGYSAALAAEPYPGGWEDWSVLLYSLLLLSGGVGIGLVVVEEWDVFDSFSFPGGMVLGELGGVGAMYWCGGTILVLAGWSLLLALFVVLEVTRGGARGAMRSIE
uniref:NADH-ubiquinone oxidoreductase chain 6 n=1 Tax=Protopterus aethiopicus TaxID=7886 RepID=E3WCN4_PROAT|nr:NADH dehydrogenase subunit 6 [Protopterus aethiopicus]BAJ40861.1 NADH dehydrogenase subunit 6 [Protopterus aethiopicus]